MFALRPYQVECLDAIAAAAGRGVRRQLVVLATGGGKTVVFAHIPKHLGLGGKLLVIAHREELLDQAAAKLEAVNPELHVDVEQGSRHASTWADAIVASVATIGRKGSKRLAQLDPAAFGLVVVDEAHHCFPAGTLIDGRPIESLRIGDVVRSFDHLTGNVEQRRVSQVFDDPAMSLVRLHLQDGRTVVCTENHPFYAGNGNYIEASKLSQNHWIGGVSDASENLLGLQFSIFSKELEQPNDSVLLCGMQESCAPSACEDSDPPMHDVRKASRMQGKSRFGQGKAWEGILLKGLQRRLRIEDSIGNSFKDKSKVCVRENDRKQPDAIGGQPQEGKCDAQVNRSRTAKDGGQRARVNRSSAVAIRRSRMGNRSRGLYRSESQEWAAKSIEDRHCQQIAEGRSGSGRQQPSSDCRAENGYTKDGILAWTRVDRVEILEPGSDGRFGGLCPDGRVYNIEVEGNNNYFVDGLLCHNSVARTYVNVLEYFGIAGERPAPDAPLLVGVTATPERGDAVGLSTVFDEVVYEKGLRQMVEEGWLARIRAFRASTDTDLSGVHSRMGDYVQSELSEAVNTPERNLFTLRCYQVQANWQRAVVFCVDVQHAKDLADVFEGEGIPAAAVYGDMPTEARRECLRAFSAGELLVLTNVGVLTEGYDEPHIGALIMARPTKSVGLYLQMLGRGTRLADGKEAVTVIDLADCTDHKLPSAASILGLPPQYDAQGQDVLREVEQLELLARECPVVMEKAISIEDARRMLHEVDLLEHTRVREELSSVTALAWNGLPNGTLYLALPDRVTITAREDLLGHWHLELNDPERYRGDLLLAFNPPLVDVPELHTREDAVQMADWFVSQHLPDAMPAVRSNARWRREEPTDKQIVLLKRVKRWKPGLTKGQAADILTGIFNKRKVANAT